MSLDLQSQMDILIAAPVARLFALQFAIVVPVNPPDIVSIKDDGFIIDLDNMDAMQPYLMNFLDSRYVIWKNQDGALVVEEV